MRAETIAKIHIQILAGLIKRAGLLVEREAWAVGENPMQPGSRLVQGNCRKYRIAHVAHCLAVASVRGVTVVGGAESQSAAEIIRSGFRGKAHRVSFAADRSGHLHAPASTAGAGSGGFGASSNLRPERADGQQSDTDQDSN